MSRASAPGGGRRHLRRATGPDGHGLLAPGRGAFSQALAGHAWHTLAASRPRGDHQPQGRAEPPAAGPAGGLPLRHAAPEGLPHPAQAALRAARPARQVAGGAWRRAAPHAEAPRGGVAAALAAFESLAGSQCSKSLSSLCKF